MTTGSLEALQKYTQAVRLFDASQEEAALPLLQEATAIDSGFAMAWRKQAAILGNTGATLSKQMDATTRAYRHRDRLPEVERLATTAYYYSAVDYEPTKVAAAYRSMLAIDPDNTIALNNLSLTLWDMRQYAEAESLALRCMDHGVFSNCPFHALRNQLAQGKLGAADTTIARWQRALPNDPNLGWSRFGLAGYRGEYATAERLARELQAAHPASLFWKQNVEVGLAAVAATQGRLRASAEHSRAAQALAESRGLPSDYLTIAASNAIVQARDLNRTALAAEQLSAALAKHSLASMDPSDRPYTALARAYAVAGRTDEAQRLMTDYARAVPPGLQKEDFTWSLAAGAIAAAQGRSVEAIRYYRKARDENGGPNLGLFDIAVEFQKLGQVDSARIFFEASLARGGPLRVVFADPYQLAATYQRLGEIYEAQGDRKRAIEYYLKLTDFWKSADPELSRS